MWIIPKTLSAFVRDTEGLNLDLDERAWMLEQSAMWRSKPSAAPTWLRRLKKDAWMTRLSTRILKPSLHESFEEKYTASLEDIHVSPSVAQESEKERKTQDTCGPTSESMSGQLDLFGAFSRMSEVTPRWGYGESCPIWKKMVTERSGDCSRRRKQARLTNASDASSWPTPLEDDSSNVNPSAKRRTSLVKEVRSNWVTPNSRDWKDSVTKLAKDRKDGKKRNDQLPRQIAEQNWATPQSRDHKSAEPKEKWEARAKLQAEKGVNLHLPLNTQCHHIMEEQHPGPPAPEKSSTSGKNHGSWPTPNTSDQYNPNIPHDVGRSYLRTESLPEDQRKPNPTMKLNPNWVEQLMGLPIGWTDLGSWATESSHKPQK
jgi:hypothetical protein